MKAVSARVSPWLYFCALGISAVLIACGGGGGAKTLSVTGTAATGAAIASAPVEAKCATANATTTTAADGTFTLTSTAATLPCLLRITLPNGAGYLHSVAESDASVANITPLTEIMAANVLGASPSVLFSSFASSDAAGITSEKIAAAKAVVIAVATKAGVDLTGADPLKDVFIAATTSATGDAKDQKIDAFMAYIGSAGITIQALSTQIATSKSAADAGSTMTSMTAAPMALFAGNLSGPGSADGTGSKASLNYPTGVAIDASGNLYVCGRNYTIRKVTSAGVVTTLAGTPGVSGSADGTGAAASFGSWCDIAVDASGNVYVGDYNNHTIRKITAAGVVTTFAGTAGVSGSADGTGAAARFNSPYALAVDAGGNVFVADEANYTIRKITSAGVVTTFAGTAGIRGSADGTGAAARFNISDGKLAVDASGNVYVADDRNHLIRKITSAGVVTTFAGTAGVSGSADGTGAAASFNYPSGVAVDASGNVYVADGDNSTIRKITSAGVVTTPVGTAGVRGSADGTGAAASFSGPSGLVVDASGNLYVSDYSNNTIRKISPTWVVTTLAGAAAVSGSADGTGAAASFSRPMGVAVDASGNVYVIDQGSQAGRTIRKITSAGVVTTFAGTAGVSGSADGTGAAASFCWPGAVAVDASGNVYVADACNHLIRKITSAGLVTTFAGRGQDWGGSADGTGAAASFNRPGGVAVDATGNVYVADQNNHTIRKITSAGEVTTLAGAAAVSGSADGTGAAASFNRPGGVAVDAGGNVYVIDQGNQAGGTIRKITSAGVVTTFAGTAGVSGSADGTGAAASFNYPGGIAVDASGNVYVADGGNNTIRKITSAGVVTTFAGAAGVQGSQMGTLPGVLSQPIGIAVTPTAIYFTMANGVVKIIR